MADTDKGYGVALIASVVGLLITILLHPVGAHMGGETVALEHVLLMNVAIHSLALVSLWLSLVGLIGLSRRLGLPRVDVTAALSAFAIAVVAATIAGSISGFVGTQLARSMATVEEAQRSGLQNLYVYSRHMNGAFAKLHVAASSLAIALWSVAMWRTKISKALPFVGLGATIVGLLVIFNGRLHMDVHDLMLLVLAQSVWMTWTGVLMMRARQA